MEKPNPIFDNIKSLRTIASIEILAAKAFSSDINFLKKLDINKPALVEMVRQLNSDLLVAHRLSQLKLLLKDAEIAALSEKHEEKKYPKSDLNNAVPEHVDGLMNDIKLAVSSAKRDIYKKKSATAAQNTVSHNNKENVLSGNTISGEMKQFIELTLTEVVRENLYRILDEIIQGKKEKKSKVLDLSEASIPQKNQPNKK